MADTDQEKPDEVQLKKLALEIGPLLLFFGVYMAFDLITATGAFMVAITIALIYSYMTTGKVATTTVISAVVVLFFGGLTLYLNDSTFIKMKPTIANVIFAMILGGGILTGRLFLKSLFSTSFELEDEGWKILTLRWIGFFIFLAILNEVVWRNFSETIWVNFKVFGFLPLTLLFTAAQLPLMQRYAIDDTSNGDVN